MVNINFPSGFTPLEPPPIDPGMVGLELNRELTHWFIMQDPTQVQLTPRERVTAGNGGFTVSELPPRPQQIVKLIFTAGNSDGIVPSTDGRQRKFDFVLVAEWNATIKTDDYWIDSEDQVWVVTGVSPYNGYEVKADVTCYGPRALNG